MVGFEEDPCVAEAVRSGLGVVPVKCQCVARVRVVAGVEGKEVYRLVLIFAL